MTPEVTSTTTPTPPTPSLPDRIAALKEQLAALAAALNEESARPFPSRAAFDDLNRQKVQVRDEIGELERQCHPAALPWRGTVNMSGHPRIIRRLPYRRP